jgi:hypothetical protein
MARHKKTATQTVFFMTRYLVSSTSQQTTWLKFFAVCCGDFKKAALTGGYISGQPTRFGVKPSNL